MHLQQFALDAMAISVTTHAQQHPLTTCLPPLVLQRTTIKTFVSITSGRAVATPAWTKQKNSSTYHSTAGRTLEHHPWTAESTIANYYCTASYPPCLLYTSDAADE